VSLPYPHARNDCQLCRGRDADVKVTADYPAAGVRAATLLCQQCLGKWSVVQLSHIADGHAEVTLEWAPGRLADHGLTADR
jgi:hypothetical protein